MKLILQTGHPSACQHACIGMLCDKTLDEVITEAGSDGKMCYDTRKRLLQMWGYPSYTGLSIIVDSFGSHALGALIREHNLMLGSIYSCKESGYGHNVVICNGDLYDPQSGINPSLPWHHYVARVEVIEK